MAHAITSSVATHVLSAPAKCWAPATRGAVNVDRLTMRRGDRDVLRDLSLAFEEGAVTAIVGPSGVGKTTLICALNGLLRAASGAVSRNARGPQSEVFGCPLCIYHCAGAAFEKHETPFMDGYCRLGEESPFRRSHPRAQFALFPSRCPLVKE